MAKTTGLGATVTIDDNGGTPRDISNDIKAFDFSTPRGVNEITGVDKSAMERQLLLADFSVSLEGAAVNVSSNLSHDVFKTITSGTVTRTTVLVVGGATMTAECLYDNYTWQRGDDGALGWNASGALANGVAPAWS